MASEDRERSTERHPRRQHSFSESGRLSVPMWDSSDPERAPPPLPLNPGTQTPGTSPVKANTSATVAAAAQALVDRARENLTAQYVTNPAPPPQRLQDRMPNKTPQQSPTRGAQHKRLQSLQSNGHREFRPLSRASVDSTSSRSVTPVSERDPVSPSSSRSTTPTPTTRAPEPKDTSPTRTPRPLMLENTPPASAVLSPESIQTIDFAAPLGDITNAPTPRTQKNFESIHSQMLNLTKIANDLQKEMSALSRRSKDNATDLVALKDVTSKRDEDIRVSLREIATGQKTLDSRQVRTILDSPRQSLARPSSAIGLSRQYQDDKSFGSASPPKASHQLPRMLSTSSFESNQESERPSSPATCCVETTPSMAMLEKIVREMGTKDGLTRLQDSITKVVERSGKDSANSLRNIVDLVESIRDQSSKALIKHDSHKRRSTSMESVHAQHQALSRSMPNLPQPNIVNDEVLKVLQKIKDSVTQGGGMTGEIKSLIKELRGEVLGMGRELGRRLDTAERQHPGRASANQQDTMSREELAGIIEDNLADLRHQMESIISTRRRESSSSALSRTTVDSNEVYAVVKHALAERGLDAAQAQQSPQFDGLDTDAILNAVKEAYEAYKPEVEVQQFGLERDEILQCLKEGLEDYSSNKAQTPNADVNRDDIIEAVQEAMHSFQPPRPQTDATEIKEEVMDAVRASLEEFRGMAESNQSRSRAADINRDEVLDAVKEGFGVIRKEGAREIEISPDDLYQAVSAGLSNMDNPFGAYGNQIIESLHGIVDGMRVEFKEYSEANGRDTEQVLDAMKDGLESLRGEIESYVDRAQDVTGKEEIISVLHHELDGLRSGFDSFSAQRSGNSDSVTDRSELATFIKAEFENLHEIVASHHNSAEAAEQHKQEILRSLTEGFAQLEGATGTRGLEDSNEEQLEALKVEFEQLREAVLAGSAIHKDEIVEQVRETMDHLAHRLGSSSRGLDDDGQDTLSLLREDIQSLREQAQAPTLYQGQTAPESSAEITNAIRESINSIREQLSAEQSQSSNEALGFIREELDSLRAAIGGSLMLNTPGVDKEAIVEAVKAGLDDLGPNSASHEAVNAVREELESLRASFGNAMVSTGSGANTEEIVQQVRSELEDMKLHLASQVTLSGSSSGGANDEMLDSINSNVSGLRGDISRLHDKPVDMTVNYEILDTLKDGLSNIRVDLDRLKVGNDEIVLGGTQPREAQADTSGVKRGDIERMEVLLAQLQIKIEAMDQNMQNQPEVSVPNAATKQDMEMVDSSLREMQTAIAGLASTESSASSTNVSKEDIDAIETLLQNTKAKLEEYIIPGLETTVTREQLDGVEAVVRLTNETVDSLATKIDDSRSSKDDLAGVALLINDATVAVNDIKERLSLADFTDIASKANIEALEDICGNIKAKLDGADDMPTKSDIEELNILIADMRDSHNSMKERYEGDIDVTAQAFDDRKQEALHISEQIEDLRGFVEETRDHLKSRMKRGNEDVRALDDILQAIEEKIDDVPNNVPDLDELKQVFQSEFEKAHSAMDDLKLGHDSNSSIIVDKVEEHRATVIAEVVKKLDERFNEIMASHDDQKRVIGDTTTAINDRTSQQDDILLGTRTMADELKVTIDTFGATVTGITPALEEATQKIAEDSQTVFGKVDEMASKIDDASVDSKTNHQLTRDEISKTLAAIDGLHQQTSVSHPEIMVALKALTAIVEQQTEHSRSTQERFDKSSDDMKAHFDEGLRRLPVPQLDAPPSISAGPASAPQASDNRVHAKLDELLGRGLATTYDDTHVRGRLDELLGHATKSSSADEQMQRLEEVQQQVKATAAEVSAFFAVQTKKIAEDAESKAKEADQAALDLSKCLTEKELIEADMSDLKESKEALTTDIKQLKVDKDQLVSQKAHLSADVSSLETALKIRREELHMMDQRADALERRIIEGVMDHSRALLIAKAPRHAPNMNLKRVTSNRSTATASTATPSSVLNAGIDMAIKARADRKNRSPVNPSARRIASLNQINSNVPVGGKALVSTAPKTGLMNLKRSQTVKNPAMRKASWNPQELSSVGDMDKENDIASDDGESENENDGQMHNGLARAGSGRVASYGGRSQATSLSYLTGTETDRRTSYGSTLRSALGPRSSLAASINEESEEEEEEEEEEGDDDDDDETSSVRRMRDDDDIRPAPLQIEGVKQEEEEHEGEQAWQPRGLVLLKDNGYHTDSGLGSDLPTATLSANGANEYFK